MERFHSGECRWTVDVKVMARRRQMGRINRFQMANRQKTVSTTPYLQTDRTWLRGFQQSQIRRRCVKTLTKCALDHNLVNNSCMNCHSRRQSESRPVDDVCPGERTGGAVLNKETVAHVNWIWKKKTIWSQPASMADSTIQPLFCILLQYHHPSFPYNSKD